jgi:hypothetical protein
MSKGARKGRSSVAREMRAEYDFSKGVRGKHAPEYAAGTNVVVLDPDVAEAFPTAAMVNEALRALARIARRPAGAVRRPRKRA